MEITTEEALKVLYETRRKKVQKSIDEKADRAVAVLHELVESEDVPPVVRLQASKDILDRAGFKPVERSVVAITYPKPILDLEAIKKENGERIRESENN
jgi:hypothetical protein